MRRTVILFLLGIAIPDSIMEGPVHVPIKNGFYKISNPTDDTVLTASKQASEGIKWVVTDEWQKLPTQMWKVKTLPDGLQIIRNEEIKDNEVSKERDVDAEGPKKKFKPTHWNLVEHDKSYYEVYNGICHLHSHGKGKRITFDEDCDVPQLWVFEFVKEIGE